MKDKDNFSDNDLLDAIKRSGYLLESEISSLLASMGFFVEPNQIIEDPITGKGREIDLIAEFFEGYDEQRVKQKICSSINFIFEIKNNIFPLVLMTKSEYSPNIEIWESLKEAETIPSSIDSTFNTSFYDYLLLNDNDSIYTQYCSFSQKKDSKKELMASHPEPIYSGLSKITQYCEEKKEKWDNNNSDDDYYRRFLYLPILLIKDNLYELNVDSSTEPTLHKVEQSKLLFSYYFKGDKKISTIWVVTKNGFNSFIENMIGTQKAVEHSMLKERTCIK